MPDPNHIITPEEQVFYDAIAVYYQTPEQAMAQAAARTEAQATRTAEQWLRLFQVLGTPAVATGEITDKESPDGP